MKDVSATQLSFETIVVPVGKSNPAFDHQTDIFGGNGGAKINKFLDCIKTIVIGCMLIRIKKKVDLTLILKVSVRQLTGIEL